jgi:hypothetical protein
MRSQKFATRIHCLSFWTPMRHPENKESGAQGS